MIDAGDALYVAYAALLAGLTYAGSPVREYALFAPAEAVAPYIIRGAWTPRSDNSKTSFGQKGEINLDIVTTSTTTARDTTAVTDILNQVTALLKPTVTAEVIVLAPPLHCYNTKIETITPVDAPTPTGFIIRRILTISHQIQTL